MKCPQCQQEWPDSFKFCPECGIAAASQRGVAQVGDGSIAFTGDVEGGVTIVQPPPPGADPATLREAYLHRLVEKSVHLSLAGVDPKAARERPRHVSTWVRSIPPC